MCQTEISARLVGNVFIHSLSAAQTLQHFTQQQLEVAFNANEFLVRYFTSNSIVAPLCIDIFSLICVLNPGLA
jgi:hypothetical protein